jgi:hypothetical protein
MRQQPPSFGIVSRDCYDANLLAALRKAQARADAAEARGRELEVTLREIGKVADGRDSLDAFPRSGQERLRRLATCSEIVEAALSRSPSLKEQP